MVTSDIAKPEKNTQRDCSIDILKCLAALLITYSHMELQFGRYSVLATGGAFGDCLFFFCSGYSLQLSQKKQSFLNWYKNRINRIYPTVFSWAAVSSLLLGAEWNMKMILSGAAYFVTCIMLFYIPFYFLRKLTQLHLFVVGVLVYVVLYGGYFVIDHVDHDAMYNWTWSLFFLPMIMGAMMGKARRESAHYLMMNLNSFWSFTMLVISAIIYYVLMYICGHVSVLEDLKPLIILPQLGVVYGFYRLCCSEQARKLYNTRLSYSVIMFVGGICLEIYLVQPTLLKAFPMATLFPLNILVMYVIIIGCAYGLKVLSRLWSQTFKDEDYNWKDIIKLY